MTSTLLCKVCELRGRQLAGYCATCFRRLFGASVWSYPRGQRSDAHREKAQPKPIRSPRIIVVDGVEYEVVFDGSQRD